MKRLATLITAPIPAALLMIGCIGCPKAPGGFPSVVAAGQLIQPGYVMEIRIEDGIPSRMIDESSPVTFTRMVDKEGAISLPRVGNLYIANHTEASSAEMISKRLREDQIVGAPCVRVEIIDTRQETRSAKCLLKAIHELWVKW